VLIPTPQRILVARDSVDFRNQIDGFADVCEIHLGERNQEAALRLYLEHGEMPMHNNLSELMLRKNVVGRKNWLFSGSEGGAEVAGYLYTLVGSCMLQGLDPHEYLIDVLRRVPDYPVMRVGNPTPKAWRIANKGHTVSST